MKYILLLLAAGYLSASQCRKERINGIPACIIQKIEAIKAQPQWNPPAEVSEYLYNGQKVYLFTADCCDQFYELYDANCNFLCAPSGGITGKGDGQCSDFNEKAVFVKKIWKDQR